MLVSDGQKKFTAASMVGKHFVVTFMQICNLFLAFSRLDAFPSFNQTAFPLIRAESLKKCVRCFVNRNENDANGLSYTQNNVDRGILNNLKSDKLSLKRDRACGFSARLKNKLN